MALTCWARSGDVMCFLWSTNSICSFHMVLPIHRLYWGKFISNSEEHTASVFMVEQLSLLDGCFFLITYSVYIPPLKLEAVHSYEDPCRAVLDYTASHARRWLPTWGYQISREVGSEFAVWCSGGGKERSHRNCSWLCLPSVGVEEHKEEIWGGGDES
jgi:hypothetical protein